MHTRPCLCVLLLACSGVLQAQDRPMPAAPADAGNGAYLSAVYGDGRIEGGNAGGDGWMHGHTFEVRAGRREPSLFGDGRIEFVYYNEGHPENNHRDGFALQWLAQRQFGAHLSAELGAGPYLSMNTTTLNGRQQDDAHWGLLLSAALRLPLGFLPDGTHLRLGYNHVLMRDVHRSRALMLGIGRQFATSGPDPRTGPAGGPWWYGVSAGNSNTNMAGTDSAHAAVLEARKYLGPRLEHWALSAKVLFEGDDGARVDRRGLAGQLWYVQQVTPRFSMSAGAGPYIARNRRERNDYRANLLVSFQAERALSRQTRAFLNFNRVKTFRQTDDRDLFQIGLLKRF